MIKKVVMGIFLATVVIIVAGIFFSVKDSLDSIKNISVANVDLSQINDGVYVGECDEKIISAKVEVIVKGNRIEEIRILEHNNGKGAPAEAITQSIIANQSLQVDAVSGATGSSKVILKAVENALLKE